MTNYAGFELDSLDTYENVKMRNTMYILESYARMSTHKLR